MVGGGRVETWEIAREGVDGWGRGGAGWKCGGGWEARDGWNEVGMDIWKGTCMTGATPRIYGGKKALNGEIVTPTCLCAQTYLHIHGLIY